MTKKFCPLHSISQEPYITCLSFMVHLCKMIICPGDFFIFSSFWFLGLLGGKRGKNGPKWQKILSATPYISGAIYHMIFIYGTHVWNYNILRRFFLFLKMLIFGIIKGVVGGVGARVKEQKMVQNDKKSYLSHSVPQEQYIIWLWFLLHMYKMIISPGIFIVSKFLSFGFLGGKRVKTDLKVPISVCCTVYLFLELPIILSRFLVCRLKKWHLQVFFLFF